MRIIITGAAGFIGHNLALRLSDNHELLCLDSLAVNNLLSSGLSAFNYGVLLERFSLFERAGIEISRLDARNFPGMLHAFVAFRPDIVIHLAAVAHMDRSERDPREAFEHNVLTLENALEASRLSGAKRLIFFSSSTVYGDFTIDDIPETHLRAPKNAYGHHKAIGEALCDHYGQSYDLDWTVLRPQALYGPRCISGRVTQTFVERAIAGEPLQVAGNGKERLDFTYIDDVVRAVEQVLSNMDASARQTFNISAGKAFSLNEFVKMLKAYFPYIRVEKVKRDTTRPYRGTMSIEKARRLIGYNPKWTLETGLSQYVAWMKAFHDKHGRSKGTERAGSPVGFSAASEKLRKPLRS